MTGQMTIEDVVTHPLNFAHCAKWCAEHPEATRYIVHTAKEVNKQGRKCSMRLDCEPGLADRAREYHLDKGTYRGIDHRITADLARYLESTHEVRFNTRGSKRELTKNATPDNTGRR